ncbi:MAG: hypothetical protein QMD09_07705 [Desulfatibacillaceae bacterium]|nr:hypothetical protein [Desulfatibacillaceae bacterium]
MIQGLHLSPGQNTLAALLMMATALGLTVFWILFFTVGLAPNPAPECYLVYEKSFPLPDGFLALALFIAGFLRLKKRREGITLALANAGALIFLGILDFSFNIQNAVYSVSAFDLAANAFINAWCVGLGLFLIKTFGCFRSPGC